ncbi:exodeoxyribonuclease V subunit gamma [Halalkalibaculum sp. DA384]|uniref:exodeoxyribonuclease V subunit gamma n=1 Tax=Halalkalibaculum sp. DA384 TaxID=3373606 RepID=UPI0037540077
MLTFYRGSKLELLADEMMELYTEEPLRDPLAQEIVIVQNHGMARWLSTRMARSTGIAANLKFEFPAERVWSLYRCMGTDIPKDLPSDREPMTWALYQLLGELPKQSPYLAVWHYMRENNGEWNPLKAWKLANRIGDLFDQYLVYRPQMLLQWEKNEHIGLGAPEAWQAALWRGLKNRWMEIFTELEWNHRAEIHETFMKRMETGVLPSDSLPERITLFGLSSLPESSIELFVTLSEIVDIRWFWMNPLMENTPGMLRDSWGTEGMEFLELFQKYSTRNNIPVNEVVIENDRGEGPVVPKYQTMDLFDQKGGTFFNFGQSDISIQIHSCHSPLREIEVLYMNILDLFEQNADLEPDDILIVCPDIQTYAPFIQAVFGTPGDALPNIPYHIVDDQTGTRKELFNTFSKLLNLLESRFKVTEVLDLLSARPVRQRFDITEDELERIQRWVKETRVRWGLSGDDKKKADLPGTARFTWISGLDRMLLGFASRMDEEIFEGVFPYNRIESSEDATLLGKFSRFLNEINNARSNTREKLEPKEWSMLINTWIETFLPADEEYYRAFQGVKSLVSGMRESTELGGYWQELNFRVVLDYLENKLTGEAARGGYFGHGVIFSGVDQMRNIPSRVIGMIGMNNEAFPRNKVSPDFDLIAHNPQKGDRLQRNDDRYLFLEIMRSARELLYLSYVGQSNRDDSSRPPSVMISELLDYLQQRQEMKRREIITEHPLQAFSDRYFTESSDLFSYSPTAYKVNTQLSSRKTRGEVPLLGEDKNLNEADATFKQVSIQDLARFYAHPARYLAEQRLGIRFRDEEVISDDREPFQLDGLEGYKLGKELLMRWLNNKDIKAFEPIAKARGLLPEGWPGHQEFVEKVEEVSEFSLAAGRLLDKPRLDRVEVSLEFGDFHLTGVLDSLHANYQIFIRYGSLRPKDLIQLWIYHLVLLQVKGLDHSYESLLLTKKNARPGFNLYGGVEHARDRLDSLIRRYWGGLHQKMPLFADSSFTFAHEMVINGKDHDEAMSKAKKQWENSWNPARSEKEDPYNKILFTNRYSIDCQEFKDLSLEIWKPALESLKQENIFD